MKNRFFLQKFDMQIVCVLAAGLRFFDGGEKIGLTRARGAGALEIAAPTLAAHEKSPPRRFSPSQSHMGDPGMRGGSLARGRAPPHHGQACEVRLKNYRANASSLVRQKSED